MTAAVEVRAANHDDLPAVLCLLRDEAWGDSGVDLGDDPARRVGRLLDEPRSRLLIASTGSTVLGAVALSARSTLTGAPSEAWLEVLVARGPHRDCIGQLLVAAAERAAVELGCSRLVTECTVARTASHRLFETHGWTDVQPVSRRLGRPAQPSPGLINRFVAVAAGAATEVAGVVAATATGRRTPDGLCRAAGAQASATLEPLGVPIHLPGSASTGRVLSAEGWWIVLSPLDGVCNAVRGRGPYAFAAALVRGGEAAAGLVVELTSGRRWIGVAGAGATVDGRRHRPTADVDTRRDEGAGLGDCRVGSSAAITVELCELAGHRDRGGAEVPLPAMALHDLAAPLVVLQEAGTLLTDAEGRAPVLRPDLRPVAGLRLSTDRRHGVVSAEARTVR